VKRTYSKTETIIISDLHIGHKGSKIQKLCAFLDWLLKLPPKRLILDGDVFELWSTNYKKAGAYEYRAFQKILALSEKGTHVVYIPGNHDRAFRTFWKFTLGNIKVRNEYILKQNGNRYLVIHGDEFDAFTRNHVVLSLIIDQLYTLLIKFSIALKQVLKINTSLASKRNSEHYEKVVAKIRRAALLYARSRLFDGIIIGHTHQAEVSVDKHGITYANAGDWLENASYIVVGKSITIHDFDS